MTKIFIDPGHGGTDSGACANGLIEKSINLIVAKLVKGFLETRGIQVKLSREGDTTLSLEQRAKDANIWEADYFVSIHHNAGGGDGYEIIHSINEGKGKESAEKIGAEFEAVGQNKRKIYSRTNSKNKDYFAVIRETNMPAIITEFAFMDSGDKDIIDTKDKLIREAEAIANGILKQLNIKPIEPIKKEDNSFGKSIEKLVSKGIINSPKYWLENENYKTEYVQELIKKFASFIG